MGHERNPLLDPKAKKLDVVHEIDDALMAMAGESASDLNRRMIPLQAGRIATSAGCDMVIASGEDPRILYDILDGTPCGTLFLARRE
ncbi:MAG: hypothetical protein ACLTCB_02295 [Merdibacter sp.]